MEEKTHDEETVTENSWTPMRWDDVDPHSMEIIRAFIEEVPNLPVHVHRLLQIVSDIDNESKDIAKVASSDPALVAKILRVVNSSHYGLAKKTDNLHFAIVLLGYNEVRKIAIQASLSSLFGDNWKYKGYTTTGLWTHSYLTSICAEALGKEVSPRFTGELLTLGLMHDIGKYSLFKLAVIMKKKGIQPFEMQQTVSSGCSLEKEEQIFSINHAVVGGLLAEKWGLSKRVCSIIECHHFPSFWGIDSIPGDIAKDVATICFSDLIVNHIMKKKDLPPEPLPEYYELLGFEPPFENIITDELREKIDSAKKFITYIK